MLKQFWIPVILYVIFILAGCYQGKQMMSTYPAVTHANALNLIDGDTLEIRHDGRLTSVSLRCIHLHRFSCVGNQPRLGHY